LLAWGTNHKGQLGLQLGAEVQPVPVPVLALEGIRIVSVASHESHTIFLTKEGQLWTCGAGFSGLLGQRFADASYNTSTGFKRFLMQ